MRPWVMWCINHNLRYLVVAIVVIMSPLLWFNYLPEAFQDLKITLQAVLKASKK